MLRPAGVLLICLALGGLISLSLSSRFSSIYVGPVDTIVESVKVEEGRWVVMAASVEFEVPSMEGVGFLVQVRANSMEVFPNPPTPVGTPTPPLITPAPIPTKFESATLYILDDKVGRAIGLPWTAGAPTTVLNIAREVPHLAANSAGLQAPDWSRGEYLEGEISIPGEGKWYLVFVGEVTVDQPIPGSGINQTVECFVDAEIAARVHPELGQYLRTAYLAGVGVLLIALDWIRRKGVAPSAPS